MPDFGVIKCEKKCEEIVVTEVKKKNSRRKTHDTNVLVVSHQNSSSISGITPW
jgi:hypothetical protein